MKGRGRRAKAGLDLVAGATAGAQATAPPASSGAPVTEARLEGKAAREAVREALSVVPVILTRVELWRIDRLVPLARNPRTHSEEQIAQIAASMREFGFLWPIIVNGETCEIVAGNGRYLAARRLGLRTVPVVEESHLTPVQRRAFIIADNKIALNAGWSDEILAEELPALGRLGFDLGITGFSEAEIAEVVAGIEPDPVDEPPLPEPPEEPVTRRGDLWLLGDHRVLCGDATSLADLCSVLGGHLADAAWTDPPFNVAYQGSAGAIQNDDLPEEEFEEFLRAAFGAMFESVRPGAPIYVAHSDTGGFTFRKCFVESGFKMASCLIWRKNSLVLSRGDYHWQHEPILYGWKPGAPHAWYGTRDKTTILEFDGPAFRQVADQAWQIVVGDAALLVRGQNLTVEQLRGSVFFEDRPTVSVEHPTMKPVSLIQRMLLNSARRGAVVLDPFGGSGSTLIACESLGLRGRLIELDERFVDVIVSRWQNLTGRRAKHVRGDGA